MVVLDLPDGDQPVQRGAGVFLPAFLCGVAPAREFVFPPAVLVGVDIGQDGAKDWC
jgi:hypothetical protein